MVNLAGYLQVQDIALRVLRDVTPFLREGTSERDVAERCIQLLQQYGATECWYYNAPAMVLVGERTTLSLSGRDYQPAPLEIRADDLVTIDLAPMVNGCWGDCARSYIVESGRVVPAASSASLGHGVAAERELHAKLLESATPDTTMHELYRVMNQIITDMGYQNLDFKGNLGHSIEKRLDDRRYIEANNHARLGDCELFTFEPHLCRTGDAWGFKLENIYYFESGKARVLGSADLLDAVG